MNILIMWADFMFKYLNSKAKVNQSRLKHKKNL